MTQYEQSHTQETIGRQFIEYVTNHSDAIAVNKNVDPELIREGYWTVNIELPLPHDTIKEISFLVRDPTLTDSTPVEGSVEDYEAVTHPTYEVGIHLRSGAKAYYTYLPNNPKVPYAYDNITGLDTEAIQEVDLAQLITELGDYEAAGLMTKIAPEAN